MHNFFKGWKRKAGVVTLGLACLFMAGWVRSQSKIDEIAIRIGRPTFEYSLSSRPAGILLYQMEMGISPPATLELSTKDLGQRPDDRELVNALLDVKSRVTFLGFVYCEKPVLITFGSPQALIRELVIPYWSIVAPLTLLSAFLLLSKPRPAKPSEIKPTTR